MSSLDKAHSDSEFSFPGSAASASPPLGGQSASGSSSGLSRGAATGAIPSGSADASRGLASAAASRVRRRQSSDRLQKKVWIFQALEKEPDMHANDLIDKMREHGIKLTRSSAYRAIASYKENSSLAESEVRCLKIVSAILENAEEGDHLTARQIVERAKSMGHSIHRSTIYRVLDRLCSSSLVMTMRRGRQSFYEWKREDGHHGHLTCIECGKTIEFHHDDLDEMAKSVCKRTGYEFARIEFLVRSVCFECWTIREEQTDAN